MKKKNEFWAIIDTQKSEPRFCYADQKKTDGIMAIYDKKPKIPEQWKFAKKIVKVSVEIIDN